MKINGFNLFSTGNTLPIEGLIFSDGQKIIGKVISTSADEALLEMTGRSFHAKIEGNPEIESGAVLKFLVSHDQQGRVLLKILSGAQEANNASDVELLGKQTLDPNLQKAITMALTKEGLPVNQENIENFTRLLQNFQSKYQQPLPPQVLAFIAAQKWPINPETIMTSWLFQDNELRNLLWNMLRQTGSEQPGTGILARLILEMSSKPEELQARFQTLIKQLDTLIRYLNDNKSNVDMPVGKTAADGLFGKPLLTSDSELDPLLRQLLTKIKSSGEFRPLTSNSDSDPLSRQLLTNTKSSIELLQSNQEGNRDTILQGLSKPIKERTAGLSELSKDPILNEIKQLVSKLTENFDHKALREKIEVLLDRNLALNKAVLKENSINGNYNLIPLLVNDPQNMLHEVLIKWREESSARKDGSVDQVFQMNIPTENLGEIRLLLRTGTAGTQITFKVDNDSIRKYLLKNLTELKISVNQKDVVINVALEPKEDSFNSALNGVDLWI